MHESMYCPTLTERPLHQFVTLTLKNLSLEISRRTNLPKNLSLSPSLVRS